MFHNCPCIWLWFLGLGLNRCQVKIEVDFGIHIKRQRWPVGREFDICAVTPQLAESKAASNKNCRSQTWPLTRRRVADPSATPHRHGGLPSISSSTGMFQKSDRANLGDWLLKVANVNMQSGSKWLEPALQPSGKTWGVTQRSKQTEAMESCDISDYRKQCLQKVRVNCNENVRLLERWR